METINSLIAFLVKINNDLDLIQRFELSAGENFIGLIGLILFFWVCTQISFYEEEDLQKKSLEKLQKTSDSNNDFFIFKAQQIINSKKVGK
jgi:hypothetical protein